MKKGYIVLILVLFLILITACGSKSESEVYDDAALFMTDEMFKKGYSDTHISEREFVNIYQESDNLYTVTGNIYTSNNIALGRFEIKLSYANDGGINYEWTIN